MRIVPPNAGHEGPKPVLFERFMLTFFPSFLANRSRKTFAESAAQGVFAAPCAARVWNLSMFSTYEYAGPSDPGVKGNVG